MKSATVKKVKKAQVIVKMLAAPITEFDTVAFTGRAGPFSGTAGNEGVGVVTAVGKGVTSVKVNDWVVPCTANIGTFSETVVTDAKNVQLVPNDISIADAALIGGTNSTALRLLSDFGSNDCIVQNAANTAVGQAVIQIAKARGIKTINIFPDGVTDDEVVEHLYSLGADIVVKDSYAASNLYNILTSDFPVPSLAINGAGGPAATTVARLVGDGGAMVTYGGSAPVTVPTSILVGKGVTLNAFSLARWHASASVATKTQMIREVATLVQDGALKSTVTETPFDDFFAALDKIGEKEAQATDTTLVTMP